MCESFRRVVSVSDIFFVGGDREVGRCEHVLPRLNSNDLKFLHGVNSETRKLIKRSSRAGDFEKEV